jgi:osmotically-inducible protein OsmY
LSPYGGGEAPGFGTDYGRGYGKPPRGYVRSDARIREDAYDRLVQQDWIDAEHVELEVEDGEVTLSGTVTNREDKRAVEDLVAAVLGVKDVHNQLRVGRAPDVDPRRARS